jgi:hypothetical protein
MKNVTLIIRQREISDFLSNIPIFQLTLGDEASIIEVIKAVDEEIKRKAGFFPHEKRLYKQVASTPILSPNRSA